MKLLLFFFLDGRPYDQLEKDTLPDSVFTDTPAFPSALQVFASVGGLALLAEHLPLLYPEVSRQVNHPATHAESTNWQSSTLNDDWVTIESPSEYIDVSDNFFFF